MQSKNGLALQIAQLLDQNQAFRNTYKPVIFKLSENEDREAFERLIQSEKNLQVFDHIDSQVEELVKCLQPSIIFFPPEKLQDAIAAKFGGIEKINFGTWVYYPWNLKLVHLLDEEDFITVRTNRNKHKITQAEQNLLSTKKIGVMGLSVGQSVSLTLAMERSFAELRIADFDELDLSNLNRIRTGVFNLKVPKTVIVAREIAEIDPYLKVVCFDQGITEENIDTFLTAGGKLDLLIDECDSFDIKINARKKAKALQIPVLMEGSDRGTIDIERFDLEPDRKVLHGMVEHLDMEKYASLKTMDERLPYITAVTGIETLSPRMKGSAIEIMSTISTWPQLASAVTYGGGVTADLARKILLNSLKLSGRFFLDLDEIFTDQSVTKTVDKEPNKNSLSVPEISHFLHQQSANLPVNNDPISEEVLLKLMEAVSQAPSGGNNQPWYFHFEKGVLHLFVEPEATKAYLDPHCISSYTSLGAAIENLLLAAKTFNLTAKWTYTPELLPLHAAWFVFEQSASSNSTDLALASQIPLRHTNRQIGFADTINKETFENLTNLVKDVAGADIKWTIDKQDFQKLAQISAHADLLRMFVPQAHEDFIHKEMRWNEEEVLQSEDGIGIDTLDLSFNDQIGLRLIKDRRTIDFIQQIEGGSAFKRLAMQQFMSSLAIGLITMPKDSTSTYFEGGRAMERLWLGATAEDLQMHPVNVPVLFFYKNSVEKNLDIPIKQREQLTIFEKEFREIFKLDEQDQAILMFRIFKSSPSSKRTIRKSTSKLISIGRV